MTQDKATPAPATKDGPSNDAQTIATLQAEVERLRAALDRERKGRDAAVDADIVVLKARLLDRLRLAREDIQLGRNGAHHRAVELEEAVAEIDDARKTLKKRGR